MISTDQIKLFAVSNHMAERELDKVEAHLGLDLGRREEQSPERDESYYPQFTQAVREEAAEMSRHYEVFYCLERTIRQLVAARLESEHGAGWWDTTVPPQIQENVEKNIKREVDSGVTQRSTQKIDYSTFGELGDIARHNWPTFADMFNSQAAFNKVMSSLNVLRGPVAHCSRLAPDEVVRLKLTVKDWFRLME